jgi:hypothetical protein
LKNPNKSFGFDLDNTLIDYSISAQIYSKSNNLEICEDITSLRSLLKTNDPTGRKWQEAQSWIYTEGLSFAYPNTGAKELCSYLESNNFKLQIVSHKTTHTPKFCGEKPLRSLASQWIKESELSIYFSDEEMIHYELTRVNKVKKIKVLNLNYFVDDLLEVFTEHEYPKEINSYLICSYDIDIPWVKKISSLLDIKEFIKYEL